MKKTDSLVKFIALVLLTGLLTPTATIDAQQAKPKMATNIPGKGWFTMLRLYGPLDPWFDKTWRPGEIHLIK